MDETIEEQPIRELRDDELSAVGAGSLGGAIFCGALGFVEGGPVGGVIGLIGGAIFT